MSLINQFIKSWFAGYLRSPNHWRGDICLIVYSLWQKKLLQWNCCHLLEQAWQTGVSTYARGAARDPWPRLCQFVLAACCPRDSEPAVNFCRSDRKNSWTFNFMRQLLDRPASNCYWSSLFLPHVCYYAKLDDFAQCKKKNTNCTLLFERGLSI